MARYDKDKALRRKKIKKEIKEYIFTISLALIIAFSVKSYVFARTDVEGPSMLSTLNDKDVIFVEKISVHIHNIKRNQIIIFDSKNDSGDIYVKRVIGVEGDEIEIKDGKVYLNNKILKEDYLDKNTVTNSGSFMEKHKKYKVKKGEIFVLGDNRAVSLDSRILGPINIEDVKGHVIIRVYPFNKIRLF